MVIMVLMNQFWVTGINWILVNPVECGFILFFIIMADATFPLKSKVKVSEVLEQWQFSETDLAAKKEYWERLKSADFREGAD